MGLHTELPIYKANLDLLREIIKITRNMPKDVKQAVGNQLRDECIAIGLRIYRANVSRNKVRHIVDLNEKVQAVELLLRVSVDGELRFISRGQYARMISLTQSIGRQATGWKKKFEQ